MTDQSLPRGIDHIGITVPDIAAAAQFLENALGAIALYDNVTEATPQQGTDTERTLGLPPGTRVVHMRMMSLGTGASIELFQMDVPAGQKPVVAASDLGLQHFAVYCDDVEATAQRFEREGGVLLTSPKELLGLEKGDGNSFCYARAPWGTLIELISWPGSAEWNDQTPKARYQPQQR